MPPSAPIETYLRELRDGRAIGVAETSFYGPLANLLNAAGATLKPRVRCIIHPRSAGAGIPDGGFYTPDQLPKSGDAAAIAAQIPSRGVLEVKGTADDVEQIAASPQVAKYLARYSQVLVTNYRDFLLLGRALTVEEVREVTAMARRIAAILLLEPALDANYQAVKAATIDWSNIAV